MAARTSLDDERSYERQLSAHFAVRISAGDLHAFEACMRLYTPRLVRLATAITHSPELASEVVQDVFVRLWDHRTTIDATSGVGGWLWRTTYNHALNTQRHERVERRVADTMAQQARNIPRVAYNDGAQQLEADAFLAELASVLEELPARCREIFMLKFQYDMTADEIATALGISLATTRNQLSRALGVLARAFGRPR